MSAVKALIEALDSAIVCPPGSVVIIKTPADSTPDERRLWSGTLQDALASREHDTEITVLLLPDEMTIDNLDEEGMAACGWYRDPEDS